MKAVKKKRLLIKEEDRLIVFIVVSALAIFYGLFYIYPIIKGILGSLHDWNPIIDKFDFVGLENYRRVLEDPHVGKSMVNTIYYAFVLTVAITFLGMFIAVAINSVRKFRVFFRTGFFIPVISSLVAASLIWGWIFDPNIGIINNVLSVMGVDVSNLLWLKSEDTAIYTIMIATIWKGLGFGVVIYLAGLSNIPVEFEEAARIDGANGWQTFWRIKFPLLGPTTTFVTITGIIFYFQIYVQILMMTQGGPGWATMSILYQIFYEAFTRFRFGYASALAQILFVIIATLGVIQYIIMQRSWRNK